MATQVQFRRGTTSEHGSFTGAVGEVTVDTTLDTLRVHDGSTAGGIRIAKFSEIASTLSFTVEGDDSAGVPISADGTGVLRFIGGQNIETTSDSSGVINIVGSSDITVNNISSADSTEVFINDGLRVTGTANIDNIEVNRLSSGDSTGITVAGDLLLAGNLRAEDSGTVSVDGVVEATGLTIGAAVINEAELETIDGVTAGTVAASKAVVVDSDKDIGDFRNVTLSGTLHTTTLDVREIVSTDSTNITVNEGLEVLGTLQVNEIVSSDSTEVTINNLRTQVITANDSTEILVNDAMRVSGLITGTATQAQYADLAERYRADREYDEGHVMILGGSEEITESTQENDTRIAGVISERWAYLMNEQEDGPAVALKGKVECKVVGSVRKGDVLISSSTPGHAVASTEANPLAVIGRSLVEDANTHPRKIFIKI